MRPCKPTDVHALKATIDAIEQFGIELSVIRNKVNKLKQDLKNYMNQQETTNVQTTHGFSADNG